LHGNWKYTLEFLDSKLRDLSKVCFDLDRESRLILEIIAKNGPVSETKIASSKKRTTNFSRDVVRYRLLKSNLSGKNDYLSRKNGKRIGNLQKVEKLYSLTFKGLLASLSVVPLRENFWMKSYMNMINKITDDITSKEFLNHIYYHIVLFLILHAKKDGMLTNYQNLETDFYDEYTSMGKITSLSEVTQIKVVPIDFKGIFVNSFIPFSVSLIVVGNLLENSLKFTSSSKDPDEQIWERDNYVDIIFRRWMWAMFLSDNKTPKQILKILERSEHTDLSESIIDVSEEIGDYELLSGSSMEGMAQDVLEKISPDIEIDMNNSLFAG